MKPAAHACGFKCASKRVMAFPWSVINRKRERAQTGAGRCARSVLAAVAAARGGESETKVAHFAPYSSPDDGHVHRNPAAGGDSNLNSLPAVLMAGRSAVIEIRVHTARSKLRLGPAVQLMLAL